MQRRSFLAAVGVGSVALAGCSAPFAAAGDPVTLFENYVAAHERADPGELRDFLHPTSPRAEITDEDVAAIADHGFDVEGAELAGTGDGTALVRADVTVTPPAGEGRTHERLAELRPSGGDWRIWWVAFDHEALAPRARFSLEFEAGTLTVTAEGPDSCFADRTVLEGPDGQLGRWRALGGSASGWLDGDRVVQPGDALAYDVEGAVEHAVVWKHLDGERTVLDAVGQ